MYNLQPRLYATSGGDSSSPVLDDINGATNQDIFNSARRYSGLSANDFTVS